MICEVCGQNSFESFFKACEWPNDGKYTSAPIILPHKREISVLFCRYCGFIRQESGCEVVSNYSEIDRDTARQLPDYAQSIIQDISNFVTSKKQLIIEVGSNDGSFLNALRDHGYSNILGVEPSFGLYEKANSQGHRVISGYFDDNLSNNIRNEYGEASIIICRHTLEHISEIKNFVHGFYNLLSAEGAVLIEVPDADWIVSGLAGHEIWSEHINYFRATTLRMLTEQAGLFTFQQRRINFRDTRNLLQWSVKNKKICNSQYNLESNIIEIELNSFQERWAAFSHRMQQVIRSAPRPIVCAGASHIQLNFLNFAGLEPDIDLLIDDDLAKMDRFVFLGKPVLIKSTESALRDLGYGSVILSGFPYPQWHAQIQREVKDKNITIIDPFLFK